MSLTIDYFYTLVSPFTYLGGPGLYAIAQKHGVKVVHKPVKIGDVFAASGGVPLGKRPPQRQAYRLQELKRIPLKLGMPLTLHPAFFPADDTLAAGMVLAVQNSATDDPQATNRLAQAFLRAVWAEERNIADIDTCRAIATSEGFDGDGLITSATSSAIVDERAALTADAIERGVFGAPTYAFGDQLFWGQDRLDYLEDALIASQK